MTQFQFDMICRIITNGAPALADELCDSLDALVKAYNNIVVENEQLKAQISEEPAESSNAEVITE